MPVLKDVREKIENQKPGSLLTVEDFPVSQEEMGALAKALSLLYKQGALTRLAKGLYYKPAIGLLGEVPPSYGQILAKLQSLYKEKISYLTGINVYKQFGLTTQVSKEFIIASDKPRSPVKIGMTEVRFIRSHVSQAVSDISLLQLLDAVWEIKEIPATTPNQAAQILLERFRELSPERRQNLADLAQSYPPLTRAVVGLLFDSLGDQKLGTQLKKTLNPLTSFQLPLDGAIFPKKRNWNIL
ncbi:MAG: DUF6088 family protein [Bacteriovoracia bacterium]